MKKSKVTTLTLDEDNCPIREDEEIEAMVVRIESNSILFYSALVSGKPSGLVAIYPALLTKVKTC